MVCDRCGESFRHPDWIEFCVEFDEQANNAITKCFAVPDKRVLSYDEEPIILCPSCMAKLNDWLTPDEQKPDTENKNKWNSMNVQPQCGEAVEIKFENGDLDIAYRKYADKRWFQSSGEWVASDSKIVAWRYLY